MVGPQLPEEFGGPPAPAVPLGAPAQPTVGGPTLGEVAAAQAPPAEEEDVDTLFQRFKQITERVYAPALRQPLPPESRPGLLANVLTFGMAGLAHRDYERGYNAQIAKQNAAVQQEAAKEALGLVREKMRSKNADLGLQMRLLSLQAQLQNNQLTNLDREYRRRFGEEKETFGRTHPPPTEDQAAAAVDQGYQYVPSPEYPGRFELRPLRGGGAAGGAGGAGAEVPLGGVRPGIPYEPVTPESPLGRALGPGGGGAEEPPTAGAAPTPPAPSGPKTTAQLRQERADAAAAAAARRTEATEGGKLAAMRKNVGEPMLKQVDMMLDATTMLPSGQTIGGILGSYTGLTGMRNRLRLRQEAGGGEDIQKLRALKSGDLLTQQMYRLVAVGVATELDVKPYADRLRNLEGMTKEEATNALTQVRDFVRLRLYGEAGATTPSTAAAPTTTSPTTPSPTTTTTTLPRSGTTRSGVAYRILD
jgi:hypothetical protein